jgi:hypothetical protein
MLFSLRLLFFFAISVAAVPPSPYSIDTTIAGRQRDPVGECKNRTIIEQKTLESGVVATRHLCHDLVGRMDGLGKRGNPCTRNYHICENYGTGDCGLGCSGVGFISTPMMSEIELITILFL